MKYLFVLAALLMGFSSTSAQKAKPPADLGITLTLGGTQEYAPRYIYTIGSDGKVTLDDRSNLLPKAIDFSKLHPQPKLPKRAERLTDKQLVSLVREFEASGFFEMNDSYYGDPSLKEVMCSNHAAEKALSFAGNGRSKSVSFFLGCSYSENSPLTAFLALYEKVSQILRTVKATPVKSETDTKR